jgi:hypothetical protein
MSFSYGNIDESLVPEYRHMRYRILYKTDCIYCKGERYGNPPRKKVALSEVARDLNRQSIRKSTIIDYLECNIGLCKEGPCFDRYYSRE